MKADLEPRRVFGTERDKVSVAGVCEGILSTLAAWDWDQMEESFIIGYRVWIHGEDERSSE